MVARGTDGEGGASAASTPGKERQAGGAKLHVRDCAGDRVRVRVLGSPSWDPLGPNRFTRLFRLWPGGGARADHHPVPQSRFGRNSAPPEEFLGCFGSSKARSRCGTCAYFTLSMVRPPAAAIHNLLGFGGLGDLEKIHAPRGPKQAKNAKKWIFPRVGGRSERNARQTILIAR